MTVTIRIPAVLRACCGGATEVSLAATTVRTALIRVEEMHPSLYRSICEETGRVRRHVNLFVNAAPVDKRESLETALADGDVITILPAVSGG